MRSSCGRHSEDDREVGEVAEGQDG
ncbi:MAG: hypothetical protein JWR71_705, partial [Pseudarthrobacter sp.]|nr:hypothetical protein [Pseudarthrobacter sp.]